MRIGCICPLFAICETISTSISQDDYNMEAAFCARKACAMYDDDNNCCAILTIAPRMGGRDDGEE